MSLANWHVCWYCKSDDFIIQEFDSSHPAYRIFKTKRQREWDIHENSRMHLDLFKMYYCNECELQYWNIDSFNRHKETYRHKKNTKVIISCKMCNYNTTDKQLMDGHNSSNKHICAINNIEKPIYECKECNYKTSFKSQYHNHTLSKKHNKINNEKITFECKECNYACEFKSAYTLHMKSKKHEQKVNGIEKIIYKCDDCKFKSNYKSQYEVHLQSKKHMNVINNVVKPDSYTCEVCNYTTKVKQCLDQHNRTIKHQTAVNKNGLVKSQNSHM